MTRRFRLSLRMLGRAVAVAAVAWTAALVLAPFVVSGTGRPAVEYWLAAAVYGLGGFICHQRPERSFQLWSVQMPVCARCTGIYVGGAMTAIVTAVLGRENGADHLDRRTRWILLVSVLPTAVTLLYEWTAGVTPSNWIRGLAGVPIGVATMWVVARELLRHPKAIE